MRRADEATISAGTPAEVLMERAGRAVARVVVREAGGRYGKKIAVVCGKGNNGGDGFVAARVLHHQGLRVICSLAFDAAEAKDPAAYHLGLLQTSGCPIAPFAERHLEADVIVDAVFGTGFSGEPRGAARHALEAIRNVRGGGHVADGALGPIRKARDLEPGKERGGAFEALRQARSPERADDTAGVAGRGPTRPVPRIVSIDVPSAGRVPADVVVAIAAEKLDAFFGEHRPERVEIADIGIPVWQWRLGVVAEEDIRPHLPHLSPDDHKTSHGAVLVIAGSDRTTGAALLAARGAARMGAGYVTLCSTDAVIDAADHVLPEVLKRTVTESALGPEVWDVSAEALERADAVALGPGLGTGDRQHELVLQALKAVEQPLVLDADGLNVLSGRADLLAERAWPLVITPHAAEMARLLGCDTADVLRDRPGTALHAADRFGCIVVLKGRNTLVAAPSGESYTDSRGRVHMTDAGPARAWVITSGGPELATAGTGDVLTGAIAASLARKDHPTFAAAAATFVHGLAGKVAAERAAGGVGVVAWDVAESLPEAVERIRGPYPG